MSLALFLSHGPEDREFVEEFTLLLAGTVRLGRHEIGCTAISDGSGELPRARMTIAFLSRSSLGSLMGELGNDGQKLLVLLHGLDPSELPAEARDLPIHRADHEAELEALVARLGRDFGEKDATEGRLLAAERERRMARLVELATGLAPTRVTRRLPKFSSWLAGGVLLVAVSGAGWARYRAGSSPGIYGFEEGAEGWSTSGGCTRARQSEAESKSGQFSLALDVALGPAARQGEAWVDLRQNHPASVPNVPANLGGRTVTAWVYAPRGARGDAKRPNGVQLFVKDAEWRAAYGNWQNVAEETWIRLSLDLGGAHSPSGFVAPGFDPSRVIAVGVKFGLGADPNAKFEGTIYLDAVGW